MPSISSKILLLKLLILTIAFSCLSLNLNATEKITNRNNNPLIFGFLPLHNTKSLIRRFKPLVDYLADQLNQSIRIETAPNYREFVSRTLNKRYDIVLTAPHFYYLANHRSNYEAIVKVNAPSLKAIIVAHKKSNITRLQDLKSKQLSTPSKLSLASVLIRHTLRNAGLNPDNDLTLIATPNHNSSLKSASLRLTDAAGLMTVPFNRVSNRIKSQMVELVKTQGTPHMPIAISPELNAKKSAQIQQILLDIKNTKNGQTLLNHLSWKNGFTKVIPGEYDSLAWVIQEIDIE